MGLRFLDERTRELTREFLVKLDPPDRRLLACYLKAGVTMQANALGNRTEFAHNVYKVFDDHLNATYRKRHGFKYLREGSQYNNQSFREYVFRNKPGAEEFHTSTIDMSLMLGNMSSPQLLELTEEQRPIKVLQDYYRTIFPNKKLLIRNLGFFQSPPNNPGQCWHTDMDIVDCTKTKLELSPLITVVTAITCQFQDETGVTGSTVFALGSHMPAAGPSLYRTGRKIVSPLLQPGDTVAFSGNTMHYGQHFTNQNCDHARVIMYTVLHLVSDEEASNKDDANVNTVQNLSSFYGGTKLAIGENENGEVVVTRVRRRWR